MPALFRDQVTTVAHSDQAPLIFQERVDAYNPTGYNCKLKGLPEFVGKLYAKNIQSHCI